jgi:signal transduction histidine kinase
MNFLIKIITVYTLIAALFGVAAWAFFRDMSSDDGIAKVEAIRAEREFKETGSVEIKKYPHIEIEIADNGEILIITYEKTAENYALAIGIFIGLYLLFLLFLIFVYIEIVMPFRRISELPFELAKGNLTLPLKERKDKLFGKFIWGLDNLRETLEKSKAAEHAALAKNQTQILEISHDIKTPLSAVRLYAEGLRRGVYSVFETAKTADLIIEKTRDIENFVNRITKTASDEFFHIDFTLSEFYLSEILKPTAEFYNEKLKTLGIKFIMDKYSDIKVKGDRDRALEAIFNVCENAVKYGSGEYIKLFILRDEDCVLVQIENDGNTLSESELDIIFECFRRGTNTKNRSGSGLGLYIARKIMRMSDGEAYAEIKENKFVITLVFRIV